MASYWLLIDCVVTCSWINWPVFSWSWALLKMWLYLLVWLKHCCCWCNWYDVGRDWNWANHFRRCFATEFQSGQCGQPVDTLDIGKWLERATWTLFSGLCWYYLGRSLVLYGSYNQSRVSCDAYFNRLGSDSCFIRTFSSRKITSDPSIYPSAVFSAASFYWPLTCIWMGVYLSPFHYNSFDSFCLFWLLRSRKSNCKEFLVIF